jgi:hypothetical protein
VSDDPSNVTGADWIDPFVHPPRLVAIGHRVELADGSVRVVSHVELWPWRTVVRGVYAHPRLNAANDGTDSPDTPGWVGPWEAETWFGGWQLGDDMGSEYRRTGGGMGGAADVPSTDFNIEFASPVPSQATRLTIQTPDGDNIELAI